MFEGPVTGNIPEVLDNGEVTDGTHVTAGQLALALTPYAQVTDLAVNTAASGNDAVPGRQSHRRAGLKAGQQRAGAGNCASSHGGGPGHHGRAGRRYSFGCRYRLGTASNLVMYVSTADNDYVGVTGTFLGTASQGVWSTARLDFSAPPGGIAKLHFGAFGGLIPGLVQQSAGTLDLYSMQIRASAFEGESVSVTDLLADLLALTASATLDAQGNVGCDQLLCNDVNCTDVFTTGVDASGAVSCAALTATGTVAGATLTSTGAVSGSSLSISGAASVGLLQESRAAR